MGSECACHQVLSIGSVAAKESLKIISCHLGGSSSICAIQGGKSVDTSMGFSPQSGLPMSNRCGDIDPFIIPYLLKKIMNVSQIVEALTRKSGLFGISGSSGDVRDLEEAAENGHGRASLALKVFVYEARKLIGAYAVAMGGVDAIVFTGGIGENGPKIRSAICENMEFLGVRLDSDKNIQCRGKDAFISDGSSKVKVMVIPANEELIVARETLKVVQQTRV